MDGSRDKTPTERDQPTKHQLDGQRTPVRPPFRIFARWQRRLLVVVVAFKPRLNCNILSFDILRSALRKRFCFVCCFLLPLVHGRHFPHTTPPPHLTSSHTDMASKKEAKPPPSAEECKAKFAEVCACMHARVCGCEIVMRGTRERAPDARVCVFVHWR